MAVRRRVLSVAVMSAAILAVCSPSMAQFDLRSSSPRSADQRSKVRLLADTEDVIPGETFHLAIVFDIDPKWHMYWKNPGEGAMAPRVEVEAPEEFRVGEVRWPRPIVLSSPVGDMYAYEEQFALYVPVTSPESLPDGTAEFVAKVTWAVCDDDMCLVGSTEKSISLETSSSTVRTLQARQIDPVVGEHFQYLAKPLMDQDIAAYSLDESRLRLAGPAKGHETIGFIPLASPGVTYGEPSVSVTDDRFEMVIELDINPNNFLDSPPDVGGLITLGDAPTDPSFEISMPLRR